MGDIRRATYFQIYSCNNYGEKYSSFLVTFNGGYFPIWRTLETFYVNLCYSILVGKASFLITISSWGIFNLTATFYFPFKCILLSQFFIYRNLNHLIANYMKPQYLSNFFFSPQDGFSRGLTFGNDDFSLESLDPLKNWVVCCWEPHWNPAAGSDGVNSEWGKNWH